MTSELAGAFVWIWMPGETDPVVAGRIERRDQRHVFFYAGSYLARSGAVPIYEPELATSNSNRWTAICRSPLTMLLPIRGVEP
jgi:hypothetical protein